MKLGERLREARKTKAISLRGAAEAVGVDPSYLSRVEAGKVPPSEQLLIQLSATLGVPGAELLLLAGRLPATLLSLVERQPYRVAAALRDLGSLAVHEPGEPYGAPLVATRGQRAIEDGFPFEELSDVAEIESWRKEVYRPIYHIHKWWAQRLGSVFRAAILAAAAPRGTSVMDTFYEPVQLPGLVVFDPFMGSGTTIGEAHKLGCTAIGRDINPVAYRAVRTALGPASREEITSLFRQLEVGVGKKLQKLYRSCDSRGNPCDVLYYFWVKVIDCPECQESVDLFSRYDFARNAYVKKSPAVRVFCPACEQIFDGIYGQRAQCPCCQHAYDPACGPAKRTTAICPGCAHEFPIAKTVRAGGKPPAHRMYAKLVLRKDGQKEYLPITPEDRAAYKRAQCDLAKLAPPLPNVEIKPGYNTKQIINYSYTRWHQLFNDRQLLTLSLLAQAIQDLPEGPGREALATLFSGVLEFNNMFASYKGEGTGAVRHMFSHHILKPERMPIEASLWGTPKSSGAFSTLYRSRLLRALDYREAPFEIAVDQNGKRKCGRKVFGVSSPVGAEIRGSWPKRGLPPGSLYLSCGDSAKTDLPDQSVDLVVTDPPFFDNVHYSELADFFHVWQELYFTKKSTRNGGTTRHACEVQDTEADAFARKLEDVFRECFRVLKDEGLLVFSYHHSREDGWLSVARAVLGAGFNFVECQPVKAELSVAAPKSQAKEPIDLDVLLVCRKRAADLRPFVAAGEAWKRAQAQAEAKVVRFNQAGRRLSRNDVRVVFLSQLLITLSAGRDVESFPRELSRLIEGASTVIESLWSAQLVAPPREARSRVAQLSLFNYTEDSR